MAGTTFSIELLVVSFIYFLSTNGLTGVLGRSPDYDELYYEGMRAYIDEDWQTAVTKYEEAITDWKRQRAFAISCRKECKDAFNANKDGRTGDFAMDYLLYLNHMRNCSKSCITEHLGPRFPISKSVQRLFDNREPFGFLQFAYHKVGNDKMAARAATTLLRFMPNDDTVKANLMYYKESPDLKDYDYDVILEPVQNHELYEKGRMAYNAENWPETVDYFEKALKEYVKAYKECQMFCEIEVENSHQYYRGGVYGYHMQLLLCRLDCPRKLSRMFNQFQPGHLSKHYDFLQYSYGQLERYEEALQCAVTFQLFNPNSDHMPSNIEYYEGKGLSASNTAPREEGLYLYKDIWSQMQLLRDVKAYLLDLDEEYTGYEDLEDSTYEKFMAKGLFPDELLPTVKEKEEKKEGEKKEDEPYKKFPPPTKEHIEDFLKTHKDFEAASLTMMEQQLNGSYRVIIDGIATEQQCKELMELGLTLGHAGDGYANNPSPHTVKEKFLGVNINNATWAAVKGEVSPEAAELYFNLSEKVRVVTEVYFKLTTPLYFSYTHLVCRKAISDLDDKGMHISHPIHSDNCILKEGKVVTCVKESPAYTWRDYSAILYLNDEYVGGQFVFASPNKTVEAIVKPKCGRMVAFSAGFENLHGVLGIKEGTRCALPLWFTLDKEHDEDRRYDAERILRDLRIERSSNNSADTEHKEL